jgi:hypothetical protein
MELSTHFLATNFTLIGLVYVIADVSLIIPFRGFSCVRCLDKYIEVEDGSLIGKPISFQLVLYLSGWGSRFQLPQRPDLRGYRVLVET